MQIISECTDIRFWCLRVDIKFRIECTAIKFVNLCVFALYCAASLNSPEKEMKFAKIAQAYLVSVLIKLLLTPA